MRRISTGKAGYAAACLASATILVVAAYAHKVVGLADGLGSGASLGSSPSFGAMNILVMGLESRTTLQGQFLTQKQLDETHSGRESSVADGLEGSQDTDTLILIHVSADGKKAVGFSIPRDDVVNYPHAVTVGTQSGSVTITEGKIDGAYADAYNQSMDQTADTNESQAERALKANQAGQLFEVQTVESVTGVTINHFIVSNIIGFLELSQQFGGLEICIQPAPASKEPDGLPAGANLTDNTGVTDNSGFDAYSDGYKKKKGGKQYLRLSPGQSLAYVRSRDTLPGIDIGRTARQQAAIEYIVWKLRTSGILSDVTTLPSLLDSAQNWLMYDSSLNPIPFAQDMQALSSSGLHFTTLNAVELGSGVDIPGLGANQAANYIDVPQIQQQVNKAFYGGSSMIPPTAKSVTADVYNGSGADNLAAEVSQDLVAMGYKAGAVADASAQPQQDPNGDTEIFYGSGSAAKANAQVIANVMGADVSSPALLSSLPAGHVEVLLGSQVIKQAPGLEMFGADTVDASDYISGAQQNNDPIPSNAQAASNASSASEVPAYSEPLPASSSSSGSSAKTGSGHKKTSVKKKAASGGSPSNPNPPYGLTTCPY